MGGLNGKYARAKKSWIHKIAMASLKTQIRQNPSLFGKLLKLFLPRMLWRHTFGREMNSEMVIIEKVGQPACNVSTFKIQRQRLNKDWLPKGSLSYSPSRYRKILVIESLFQLESIIIDSFCFCYVNLKIDK